MWFLESARQQLGIDDDGRICWLSGASGENRIAGEPVPVLRLTLRDGAREISAIPCGPPSVLERPDRLDLCWTSFAASDGSPVSLVGEVCVWVQGGGFAWSLRLGPEPPVADVLFPVAGGLRGDMLILPYRAGERLADPARTLHHGDGVSVREIAYCGEASMSWLELDSPSGGTYLGSHDPQFRLAGLRVETDGKHLTLALRRYRHAVDGELWETPPAVLAAHDGDWRQGARIYRQWIAPLLPRPQISTVAVGRPAVGSERNVSHDRCRFTELPTLAEQAARKGIDHLIIGGWQRSGRPAEISPDLELGTLTDLAESCQAVQEHGQMVTLHLEAGRFDTASEYYPTLGARWTVKDQAGVAQLEHGGSSSYAIVCPVHDEWRHYLLDAARWLLRTTGCQGLLLAGLGASGASACYEAAHNHRFADEYNLGSIRLVEELLPETTLIMQHCADLLSSRAWASCIGNDERQGEFAPLYRYTFPEHRLITAVQPRVSADRAARERLYYRDLERAWLLGSYLWASPRTGTGPDDQRLTAHLAQVIALRRAAERYLAPARYADFDGLAVDGAKVTRFDGPGYMALAVANPLGVPGEVLVPTPPASVTCLELGRIAERSWSKDGRRLLLPTAPLSLLILRM